MLNSRKTFKDVYDEFDPVFKLGPDPTLFCLYIRKLAEDWKEITDLSKKLLDEQLDNFVIIVFIQKDRKDKFH